MRGIINYTKYGIDLNIPEKATKEQKINALLQAMGGPQMLLNHFLLHFSFIEDFIPDAETIATETVAEVITDKC